MDPPKRSVGGLRMDSGTAVAYAFWGYKDQKALALVASFPSLRSLVVSTHNPATVFMSFLLPQGCHQSPLDASCGSTLSTSRVHSSTSHPGILAKTGERPPSCRRRVLPVLHHPPPPELPGKSFRLVALSPPQFFPYSWVVHLVCPFRFCGSCFLGTIHYIVALPTSRAEDCASIVTGTLSLPISPIR